MDRYKIKRDDDGNPLYLTLIAPSNAEVDYRPEDKEFKTLLASSGLAFEKLIIEKSEFSKSQDTPPLTSDEIRWVRSQMAVSK